MAKEEFMKLITLQGVCIYADGRCGVDFNDHNLFEGHVITAEISKRRKIGAVDIKG
ncbi:MAG: DUF2262 domain-containing protein [Candidatus Gribaldobacteria bacterium]|nr:DUF2262 domain-containing protein [Candidatus Gribaldobacteria bacterium]